LIVSSFESRWELRMMAVVWEGMSIILVQSPRIFKVICFINFEVFIDLTIYNDKERQCQIQGLFSIDRKANYIWQSWSDWEEAVVICFRNIPSIHMEGVKKKITKIAECPGRNSNRLLSNASYRCKRLS
jgi:hypothetical protein